MSDQPRVGILRAIFRFFMMWNWRKARGILDAADAQFTKDPQGIGHAFDIEKDEMVVNYQQLVKAFSGLERGIEDNRIELEELEAEEKELLLRQEGALVSGEQAQAKGDTAQVAKDRAAYERFRSRIAEIDERQAELEAEIDRDMAEAESLERDVKKLQHQIDRQDVEKARAIKDFIKYQSKIDLHDRIKGLKTSVERGPTNAVRERIKQLRGEAAVRDRLSGADVSREDDRYADLGKTAEAGTDFDRLLAARKVEKAAKTGDAPVRQEERPEI